MSSGSTPGTSDPEDEIVTRKIFDEPTAHRERGLQPGEPEVAWFTKVSRPDAAAGRRLVNELFARFPDQSPRMGSRLHSEDDSHLLSALDELFVYDLLAKRYTVGYEEGDGKHPDFHLYHGDEYVGRVEVLTPAAARRVERRRAPAR